MDRFAKPYPVLIAFGAFLAGIVAAGMLGTPHAVALIALVAALAWVLARVRATRVPGGAWPVVAIAVAGCLRLGVAQGCAGDAGQDPDAAWNALAPDGSGPAEKSTLLVRLGRVVRRDRLSTSAEAVALAVLDRGEDGDAWRDLPDRPAVVVRHRGFLGMVRGTTCVARGRLVPPEPPGDSVSPSWPAARFPPAIVIGPEEDLVAVEGPEDPAPSAFDRWRLALAERLRLALPGPAADFALAILLGEGGGIEAGLRIDLALLGTAHVLSVSGLHVAAAAAIVGLVVLWLAGPVAVRLTPRANLVVLHRVTAAAAALLVAALAGLCAPALRSAWMFVTAVVATLLARRVAIECLVAAVGLASLLADPADAFSLSFLLSYAAILGIATATGPLARLLVPRPWRDAAGRDPGRVRRFVRASLVGVAASAAATLATTPITALAFGTASAWAPLVNWVVVPATTLVVMPVAIIALVLAATWPGLLGLVSPVVTAVFDAFNDSQRWLAMVLPGTPGTGTRVGLCCLVALPAAAWAGLATRSRAAAVLAGLAGLAAGLAFGRTTAVQPGDLAVTFLDVGKGDATLVRCPDGRAFLVDTGEARASDGGSGLIAKLGRIGVRRLDGIVLTHSDDDHVGGTLAVASAFPVGLVAYPCPSAGEDPLPAIARTLAGQGVPTGCLVAGMEAIPGCGDRSRILWPPWDAIVHHNDASLVFRLERHGRSVALTGDLPGEREIELVSGGFDLRADVLKLGHHGSASSSTPELLQAVRPSLAVVSGYGNSVTRTVKPEVIRRVSEAGATILSTREKKLLTVILKNSGSQPVIIKGGI